MISWRFFKSFPKYAIAIAIFAVSTGLFALWWFTRPSGSEIGQDSQIASAPRTKEEATAAKAKTLPEKMGWLALVGNDLYDIGTGELIFKDWLQGMPPQKLFYQKDTNRLMAQYERGIVRYGLDGKQDGFLGDPAAPPAFTHDGKMAMFVRDGDVWIAEVDWKGFRFINERQATKYGKFNAPFFAANTLMGSEKALLVRNQNQILKVNLLTGDVQQIRLPTSDLVKRRSPDGRFLIGDAGNIYVLDVEAPDAYNFPESRWRAVDFQWLSNDRCAFIIASKSVSIYDRKQNSIKEVTALPFECSKIVGPSPNGRYAICAGRKGIAILDTQEKTAIDFGTPAENFAWVTDDTVIYTRDVPDSTVRGTWLRMMSQPERRLTLDPYMVGRDGTGAVESLPELGITMFVAREIFFGVKFDGSALKEIAKLEKPVTRLLSVQLWGR